SAAELLRYDKSRPVARSYIEGLIGDNLPQNLHGLGVIPLLFQDRRLPEEEKRFCGCIGRGGQAAADRLQLELRLIEEVGEVLPGRRKGGTMSREVLELPYPHVPAFDPLKPHIIFVETGGKDSRQFPPQGEDRDLRLIEPPRHPP